MAIFLSKRGGGVSKQTSHVQVLAGATTSISTTKSQFGRSFFMRIDAVDNTLSLAHSLMLYGIKVIGGIDWSTRDEIGDDLPIDISLVDVLGVITVSLINNGATTIDTYATNIEELL